MTLNSPVLEPAVGTHRRIFDAWPSAIPVAIALGLCGYQLAQPDVLFGVFSYDDGVYFGVATRLANGVLPYRDFVFVHPPGIAIVLSPIALVGRAIGTRDSLAIARIVTALVTGCNVALVGLILRKRGRFVAFIGALVFACFPQAVAADNTVLLEPYLVCACLVGILIVFDDGELASTKRLFVGGVVLGFAGTIKIWAFFPMVALLVCCLPRVRSRVFPALGGMATGFIVPVLFFFLAAPGAFIHEVFTDQIARSGSGAGPSLGNRLVEITGIRGIPWLNSTDLLAEVIVIVCIASVFIVYGADFKRCTRLEWFALAATVLVTGAVLYSSEFYTYYSYFPAAFFAVMLGLLVSRVSDRMSRWTLHLQSRGVQQLRIVRLVLTVVLAASALWLVNQDSEHAQSFVGASKAHDPAAVIDALIPAGACVISDYSILAISADRFTPTSNGCPAVIDPFGTLLSYRNGDMSSPLSAMPFGLQQEWETWIGQAQYVLLTAPGSYLLPSSPNFTTWFEGHFRLLATPDGDSVYVNTSVSS